MHRAVTALTAAAAATVALTATPAPAQAVVRHFPVGVVTMALESLRIVPTKGVANPVVASGSPRTGRFIATGRGSVPNLPAGVTFDTECALEQLRFDAKAGRLEWKRIYGSDNRSGSRLSPTCHHAVLISSLLKEPGDAVRLRSRERVTLRRLEGVYTVARYATAWRNSEARTFELMPHGTIVSRRR